MGKKKTQSGVNRSQAIRDYLAVHPKATATEIIPALAAQGIVVSKNLVSNVKYHSPKAKTKKRSGTQQRTSGRRPETRGGVAKLTAQNLFDVKQLADELGGISAARSALDALEDLQ